jgi:16S rRNA (cytosine967-C5)-methyltransferase
MADISLARSAAHAILLAVEAGLGHADDLLRDDALMARMPEADRRLTTALVLGVLRWQIQLDGQIRQFMAKPNTKFDPAVLAALRLGAFQLTYLDRIPAHAAINDSVELVKRARLRSAAGLVNAVLRKIAASRESPSPSTVLQARDANSAALDSHPPWMRERWTEFFGHETAGLICQYDQSQPPATIRVFDRGVLRELDDAGIRVEPGRLLTAAHIVVSGDVGATTAFREGGVNMQDEGSQLVGEIAAAAAEVATGILDACAAPGGKTLILAQRNPEARIVACEVSPPRLERLRDRLSVLGERVECRAADATALDFHAEFDCVLADVPCSGTGTLSRNPEIRHRLQPGDLPRHAVRQRAILASALQAVRPGGHVVYSTCSLEPEENEEVVRDVVELSQGARVLPLSPMLETLRDRGILTTSGADGLQRCVTPEGFLRLVPGAFGTDGFFVALLAKE